MIAFIFFLIGGVVWLCLLPFQKHLTFWSSTAIVVGLTVVISMVVLSAVSNAMFGG